MSDKLFTPEDVCIELPHLAYWDKEIAEFANAKGASLLENHQIVLKELVRLQELCRIQEQYGTKSALKVVEENIRLLVAIKTLEDQITLYRQEIYDAPIIHIDDDSDIWKPLNLAEKWRGKQVSAKLIQIEEYE